VIAPRPSASRPVRDRQALTGSYQAAPPPVPITLPITSDTVRTIASKGFPLWEPVEVMQLRNRRITLAYSDLSCHLAALLAGDGPPQANWCTFATWSSKTIGTWIEKDPAPPPRPSPWWLPGAVAERFGEAVQWLVTRDNGATYRSLAAGNRYVFLEIGLAVACFLETFADLDPDPERRERQWHDYWSKVRRILRELGDLDPSWMLTEAPPAAELGLGLRKYFEALTTDDPCERAQLVLAGNLAVGAYEQRRVDGYVTVSLALFTRPAMRRLIRRRFGLERAWYRWPSAMWARLMTRFLVLSTPDQDLAVCHALPRPPGDCPMFPDDLDLVGDPTLQALLTRYDLSEGRAKGRRVRDWTSYDDRMSYIANLFRSRQQHAPLFTPPFPPDVTKALLEGRLAPAATTSVPTGTLAG
jgi:hypothetical protein